MYRVISEGRGLPRLIREDMTVGGRLQAPWTLCAGASGPHLAHTHTHTPSGIQTSLGSFGNNIITNICALGYILMLLTWNQLTSHKPPRELLSEELVLD